MTSRPTSRSAIALACRELGMAREAEASLAELREILARLLPGEVGDLELVLPEVEAAVGAPRR